MNRAPSLTDIQQRQLVALLNGGAITRAAALWASELQGGSPRALLRLKGDGLVKGELRLKRGPSHPGGLAGPVLCTAYRYWLTPAGVEAARHLRRSPNA